MISKRFAKLSIIKNYKIRIKYEKKYEAEMTRITFKFLVYPSFEKNLEERLGETKNI